MKLLARCKQTINAHSFDGPSPRVGPSVYRSIRLLLLDARYSLGGKLPLHVFKLLVVLVERTLFFHLVGRERARVPTTLQVYKLMISLNVHLRGLSLVVARVTPLVYVSFNLIWLFLGLTLLRVEVYSIA